MTDLRQAAQQALECIERLNAHGWILADFEDEVESAIAALKAALEQPEQEPSQWRDMVVVSLVREGINKHRARELADHFERNT
jgi:benzoyl-CoA reductase/2-hydroxyglutaryl-CoA dehydratase subunit BcrC/BadD/HgdB